MAPFHLHVDLTIIIFPCLFYFILLVAESIGIMKAMLTSPNFENVSTLLTSTDSFLVHLFFPGVCESVSWASLHLAGASPRPQSGPATRWDSSECSLALLVAASGKGRTQVKISRGKGRAGQATRDVRHEAASCPLPVGLGRQCLFLPRQPAAPRKQ